MCIFCPSVENIATVEHVFPEAIGGALTIQSVCKPCNDRLGSDVDVHLTDDPLVRMLCLGLRIPSKDGSIRSPLHGGSIVGHPEMRGSFKQPSESVNGMVTVRPAVTRFTEPDGRERIKIEAASEEFAEILATIEQRAERRGQKIRVIEQWETAVTGPVVSKDMSGNPAALVRPLLKIAYELATEWLGPRYCEDPTAVALRRAICTGHVEDIDAEIGYFPPRSAFAGWAVPSVSHAANMWAENGYGYVGTRIFAAIEAKVRVTDTLAHYGLQPTRWIVLDPTRATVDTGLGVPVPSEESAARIAWTKIDSGAFEVRTFYEGLETTKTTLAISYGV